LVRGSSLEEVSEVGSGVDPRLVASFLLLAVALPGATHPDGPVLRSLRQCLDPFGKVLVTSADLSVGEGEKTTSQGFHEFCAFFLAERFVGLDRGGEAGDAPALVDGGVELPQVLDLVGTELGSVALRVEREPVDGRQLRQ